MAPCCQEGKAISFQEVGTCHCGDCRWCPSWSWWFSVYLQPCLISLCLSVPSQDAFSLLAYSDPWNCPVGQQLDPIQREPVCAALNSAILGKIWFLWEYFPRHTCSQGLSCGRQAWQKYLCLTLAFLSVAGGRQGRNAGRGVGGKPAENRSPDTLPF